MQFQIPCLEIYQLNSYSRNKNIDLTSLGYFRLLNGTPIKLDFREHLMVTKGNRGRSKHTQTKETNSDLKSIT